MSCAVGPSHPQLEGTLLAHVNHLMNYLAHSHTRHSHLQKTRTKLKIIQYYAGFNTISSVPILL